MIEQRILVNSGYYTVTPVVHMVQNDTGRTLICELTDYVIDNVGTGASLLCERPDGTYYSYLGTIDMTDNTVTIDMEDEGGALSQAGIVKAQLLLTDVNNYRIKSYEIRIVVEQEIPDAVPTPAQHDYVDALQSQFDAYIAQKTAQITQNTNDIDALEALIGLTKFSLVVAGNGSTSMQFPSGVGTRAIMICLGYSVGTKGLWLVTCSTTGAVNISEILAGSNLSVTTSSRTLTLANTSTVSNCYVHWITFAGSVTAL